MKQYLDLLSHTLENGVDRGDRTGTGTRGVFGYQTRFDLKDGFPLVTTKKLHLRSIIVELLWFIRGDTNVKFLQEHKVKIWDAWADEDGELGPVYGAQWRSCPSKSSDETVDQLGEVIESLKNDPNSRRHIVCSWNPPYIDEMNLPPCHCLFQFYVSDGKLSCQLYQRSADIFLGVPFNIASYALLIHMVAQVCDLEVGEFIHTFGDAHIYHNHMEQVREQLNREPLALPELWLNPDISEIDQFKLDDIKILGYEAHPHIAGKVAV